MPKQKLLMIGNGMAGVRTIEEILDRDPEKYDITIIGDEPHPNYNRIMLSNILQNKMTPSEIILNDETWYASNNITLHTDEKAILIDRHTNTVTTTKRNISYDKLILATGSRAFILPIPGADLEGVLGFRTIADTEKMIETSKKYERATVIGGGLLGLEAARGLLDQGMDVTVIHLADWLMETQLDAKAGELLKADLEKQGMKFLMQKATAKIIGKSRVTGLAFKDGTQIETDLVVMAIGIKPEIELAQHANLPTGRGIVVDDFLNTADPDIFAVGECAEHNGIAYGLVAPLYEQGKVLADHLCGIENKGYRGSKMFTQLKVSGCDLFSAGDIKETADIKGVTIFNSIENKYKKIFMRDEKLVGVVLYGDTTEGNRLYNLLKKEEELTDFTLVSLLHKSGESENVSVAEMPDDESVCGCNGVTKGDITRAITDKGLTTIGEVTAHTKAGGSCGKCKPIIGDILEHTLGDDFVSAAPAGICGCTDLTRDQLIIQIRAKQLQTAKEVRHVLAFRNPEGCSKCRPALNYYLNMIWPQTHADEPESRYVNERLHANIQNDGTYSVIPRMYAGQTDPQQLIKIAKVAEKYNVPLLKLTGGQRIGLYGVKKEDLPKIWEELDMRSGFAYGKTLRTVKSCVGSKFCRFGTQDALALGEALERQFEFVDTPHKFKMGVSGCPRSCVESGVKDYGIICVENGYQIYIGGNGGTEVKEAQLLTTVATEQEVLDICSAFVQYYRETGVYMERTAPWLERMGMEHVREIILDPTEQAKLKDTLAEALAGRDDPWKQVLEDEEKQKLYHVERV
ncbi:NAD(P)/FAD-dependent oxidoreductase [Listeria weihenstephanensis]|uniref:NAD(P)/FAD-dependent oxidoreductase n=1 Tax=Listeria weihenstephanensis TaxID=1006155 RepID=A0A1S7FR36_9LIST|nr:nitrite reductase large subunit NirB [Listeria weihenstephanensis]AQY49829.1 nitrite reductase [Listeria weihenstephanensis]MBC1498984.1 NAD(P)/FAD-dependent oxidoreductase [Listeria weihenstephanensis]